MAGTGKKQVAKKKVSAKAANAKKKPAAKTKAKKTGKVASKAPSKTGVAKKAAAKKPAVKTSANKSANHPAKKKPVKKSTGFKKPAKPKKVAAPSNLKSQTQAGLSEDNRQQQVRDSRAFPENAELVNLAGSLVPDLVVKAEQSTAMLLQLPALKKSKFKRLLPANLSAELLYLHCCSDYFRDALQTSPELLESLILSDLSLDRSATYYSDTARTLFEAESSVTSGTVEAADEEGFMQVLRQWRCLEMLRILWRDLLGYCDTATTLVSLSALADAAVQIAEEFSYYDLVRRFGIPVNEEAREQRLIILGMGKLGGRELNFSSDIDLIMVFPDAGETVNPASGQRIREISNEEFFQKQAQAIVKLLGKVTADGFVFRVDLRLRPYGSSGPLALNFQGLENYYLLQGREWERYAMIKARALTGDKSEQQELMKLLRPFVYRRYLDYTVFASLRELKIAIASELEKKGEALNIKTGLGGIREIEFIGQAFQLLRGGREPELQRREILKVLEQLQESKLLEPQVVEQLSKSYEFLRRLENRLQMLRDEQEHCLPEADELCNRITLGMGLTSYAELLSVLEHHRRAVNHQFSELFSFDPQAQGDDDAGSGATKSSHQTANGGAASAGEELQAPGSLHLNELQAWFEQQHFAQPQALATRIAEFRGSGFYANLTQVARQRAEKLLPKLVLVSAEIPDATASSPDSGNSRKGVSVTNSHQDETLLRLLELVRVIAGRSGYLQILIERPAALELLAGLFSRSSWLAEFVTRHPIVIDELLDERNLREIPTASQLHDQAGSSLLRLQHEDLGMQMDALRQFKQANTMRVAVAELHGMMEINAVGQQLTRIAEAALSAATRVVLAQMQVQHGKPGFTADGQSQVAEFAIVAYGKLGSAELGLGSDLDIVFLHDSEGDVQQTSGERCLENAQFFGRTAQKIVHFISTLTPAGVLYEIDARLRPNGRAGMLVSSLQAFESYQKEQAWVWEHQALVRARVVVGSNSLIRRFDKIRSRILGISRDKSDTAQAVAEMRGRMAQELCDPSESLFDVKHASGGLVDIEFMVQYLVLVAACEHPEMLENRDNHSLIATAAACGLLDAEVAQRLAQAYSEWHARIHRMSLQEHRALIANDEDVAMYREWVSSAWADLLPEYGT